MVFPGDLSSNRVSPWRLPKPTLQIWFNASPTRGGAHTDSGEIFQHDWIDKEPESTEAQGGQIGATPVGQSQQYCAATSRQHDGTWSPTLCKKSLWLWCQVIPRQLTILPPQWLASEENREANFLSRLSLQRWDFKLVSTEFWKVFQRLHVCPLMFLHPGGVIRWPGTWPGTKTLEQWAYALVYQCDPLTWLI